MKILVGMLGFLMAVALPGQAQTQTILRSDIAPTVLRDASLAAAQAVDAGQAAQLWQSASQVTRGAIQQKAFVAALVQARRPFGQPVRRQWTAINLRDVTVQQGTAKPGRYGNVDFDTLFADNQRGHELVTFRLDEDGQWRFAGYVIEAAR